MRPEGGHPSGGAAALLSIVILTLLVAASCAGTEAAGPEPFVAPAAAPAEAAAELLLYLPIESVTLLEYAGAALHEGMLELRFDRPGAWSIHPERFVFSSRKSRRLTPIQTYGSGRLSRADILVLRSASEREPGYRPAEGSAGDFFSTGRTPLDLPEALVLIDPALLGRLLYLTVPEGSRLERQGLRSVAQLREADAPQVESLTEGEEALIDGILSLGSAAGSRRGYRSILFLPHKALAIAAYPHGLDLHLGLSAGGSAEGGQPLDWADTLEISLLPRSSPENPFPDVTIGDLGVFSGATPLLDPGLPEISAELHRSQTLVRIGKSAALSPSPVIFEGSFNAYRDERRRFLFYPGVFSYIPGRHPDISSSDVRKISGQAPEELDRLLRGRTILTMRHDIYGAIPAFIAASESPTELEIAYRQNPRLRNNLQEFYLEPAFILWLD